MKIDFLKVVNCLHEWRYNGTISEGLLAVRVVKYKCVKCGITKTEVAES